MAAYQVFSGPSPISGTLTRNVLLKRQPNPFHSCSTDYRDPGEILKTEIGSFLLGIRYYSRKQQASEVFSGSSGSRASIGELVMGSGADPGGLETETGVSLQG
jgi:hypothetical protein